MAKPFPAKFPGTCCECHQPILKGDPIRWSRKHRGKVWHEVCPTKLPPPIPPTVRVETCGECGWVTDNVGGPGPYPHRRHYSTCSQYLRERDDPDLPPEREKPAPDTKKDVHPDTLLPHGSPCPECRWWRDPRRDPFYNHAPGCSHCPSATVTTMMNPDVYVGQAPADACLGCGFTERGAKPHSDGCNPDWRSPAPAPTQPDTKEEIPTMPDTPTPTPSPPAPAAGSDALTAVIAGAIMPVVEARIHEMMGGADVVKIIDDKLRDLTAPVQIQVVDKDRQVIREVGTAHKLTPQLIELIQDGEHVYIYGPPGSGKSHAAKLASQALGLPFYYVSVNPQSAAWRLEGFIDAHGSYVRVPFREAYEHGGVFCIDEMDNGNGNLWTSLNSAIANGHAAFPDGMIERHKDFRLVATGNTALRGADRFFPDRRPADPATIDRFEYLEWDYDHALERAIVCSIDETAIPWMHWVQSVRDYSKQHTLKGLWATPRASISGAKKWGRLTTKKAVRQMADRLVFKGLDTDTTKRVLDANPLPAKAA
jgi:cobaltochelatase CobS